MLTMTDKINIANRWSHYRRAYNRLYGDNPPPGQVSPFNALVAGIIAQIHEDIPLLMKEIGSLEMGVLKERVQARQGGIVDTFNTILTRCDSFEAFANEGRFKNPADAIARLKRDLTGMLATIKKEWEELKDGQDAPETAGEADERDNDQPSEE